MPGQYEAQKRWDSRSLLGLGSYKMTNTAGQKKRTGPDPTCLDLLPEWKAVPSLDRAIVDGAKGPSGELVNLKSTKERLNQGKDPMVPGFVILKLA